MKKGGVCMSVKEAILEALKDGELTPLEIANKKGLNYNTVRRAIQELLKEGYVEKNEYHVYRLKQTTTTTKAPNVESIKTKKEEVKKDGVQEERERHTPEDIEKAFIKMFGCNGATIDGGVLSDDGACLLIIDENKLSQSGIDIGKWLKECRRTRFNISKQSLEALAKRGYAVKFGAAKIDAETLRKAVEVLGKGLFVNYNEVNPIHPIILENSNGRIVIAPMYEEIQTLAFEELRNNDTSSMAEQ
jgi:DNA-binding transcriptional regulator YhcF (GntR family)